MTGRKGSDVVKTYEDNETTLQEQQLLKLVQSSPQYLHTEPQVLQQSQLVGSSAFQHWADGDDDSQDERFNLDGNENDKDCESDSSSASPMSHTRGLNSAPTLHDTPLTDFLLKTAIKMDPLSIFYRDLVRLKDSIPDSALFLTILGGLGTYYTGGMGPLVAAGAYDLLCLGAATRHTAMFSGLFSKHPPLESTPVVENKRKYDPMMDARIG